MLATYKEPPPNALPMPLETDKDNSSRVYIMSLEVRAT